MFPISYKKSLIALFLCLREMKWKVPPPIRRLFLDSPYRLKLVNPVKSDFPLLGYYENSQFFDVVPVNKQLKYACLSGNLELVKYMVSKGYTNLLTPMCCAAKTGSLKILEYLISLGGNFYNNAMITALTYNQKNIINYLIEKITVDKEIIYYIRRTGYFELHE